MGSGGVEIAPRGVEMTTKRNNTLAMKNALKRFFTLKNSKTDWGISWITIFSQEENKIGGFNFNRLRESVKWGEDFVLFLKKYKYSWVKLSWFYKLCLTKW